MEDNQEEELTCMEAITLYGSTIEVNNMTEIINNALVRILKQLYPRVWIDKCTESLAKIGKWHGSRGLRSKRRYEEEKREFEKVIGKPFIIIEIGIPRGFEDQRAKFLSLEKDEVFLEEIRNLIRKKLTYEKHRKSLPKTAREGGSSKRGES